LKGDEDNLSPSLLSGPLSNELLPLPKVKSELAGPSLTQASFQKTWDGVVWKVTQDKFAAALQW
jgi:hypothetical protein